MSCWTRENSRLRDYDPEVVNVEAVSRQGSFYFPKWQNIRALPQKRFINSVEVRLKGRLQLKRPIKGTTTLLFSSRSRENFLVNGKENSLIKEVIVLIPNQNLWRIAAEYSNISDLRSLGAENTLYSSPKPWKEFSWVSWYSPMGCNKDYLIQSSNSGQLDRLRSNL